MSAKRYVVIYLDGLTEYAAGPFTSERSADRALGHLRGIDPKCHMFELIGWTAVRDFYALDFAAGSFRDPETQR
jgi:hypothetical protein